jgi:PAS domain S-box-containing protein
MNALPCDPAELARTLFEESPDALFLFDMASERIVALNAAAARLAGADSAQLLQQPIRGLFRAEVPDDELYLQYACRAREGFLLRDHRKGTWVPVALSISHLNDSAGPFGLLQARDLRRQRDARQERRQVEAELGRMLASVSDCVWSAESDGQGGWRIRYCSPVIETITGRPIFYFAGRLERWLDIIHPEDLPRYWRQAEVIMERAEPCVLEYRIVLPDGGVRWLRDSLKPRRLDDGRLRIDAVFSDITGAKEAEGALEESRRRFEAFMNAVPVVGFMKDADGRMIYVNQEFVTRFARPAEHFLGKLNEELWPADVARRLREADLAVMAGAQPAEMCEFVPTPDGVMREWWVAKFPLRDSQGRVFLGGIGLDLTDRRHIEKALQRSESRYRELWQRNLAGIVRASLDGRILDCNDSFIRMFGFSSREEMLTRSTRDLYFDPGIREEFIARLRAQQLLTNYELQMRRADGAPIWVLETVRLLVEDGADILEGTLIDISDRKRAEEALRASETNYRTLIDHLDQAIFLKDRELRYIVANPVFCAGVGVSEDELRGKTIGELFPDLALAEKSRAIERRVLEEGRAIETEDEFKVIGKPRSLRISRTPVKDPSGAVVGVLGICWDVTEQRKLEAQLRHVQKMDAIGQLAGGIAHDFNNLLTIMLGNLSYVLTHNHDQQVNIELLKNAEKAGLRAAELTQTLLGFSHRAALATVSFDLNEGVEEVVRLTRSTLPAGIQVEVHAQPHLWLVQADPGHINQVLTNLTLNARDAMPEGGKIVFETSHFVPDAEYLSAHVEASPGEFVRLRVRDTGPGVPAELRQRIFEPFFTTKEKGKGTGLGLAIAFSIIKQHRGWIVCDSEPSHGTTFDLFLPRCQAASTVSEKVAAPLEPVRRNMILLVDDEPMIRQLTKTILTKAGFPVLLAENGAIALDVLQAQGQQVALVILDAVMPRLSGRDTLRELLRVAPGVRVIFSSGYSTEQMGVHEFPQVRGFLPKPYRAEQLIAKVSEILSENQ